MTPKDEADYIKYIIESERHYLSELEAHKSLLNTFSGTWRANRAYVNDEWGRLNKNIKIVKGLIKDWEEEIYKLIPDETLPK